MMANQGFMGESHEVKIVNREQADIKGVIHVDSFDDQEIVVDTDMGVLTIKGEDLHIKHLDLEQGNIAVEGLIAALQYSSGVGSKANRGKGFFERLLK